MDIYDKQGRLIGYVNGNHKEQTSGRHTMDWRERITIDPAIHHGKSCITGTRVPVSVIVGSIAEGFTPERIIDSWPQLTIEDIKAALKFAAKAVSDAEIVSPHGDGK
jgi:uncharacterized protein (DUF433 family)